MNTNHSAHAHSTLDYPENGYQGVQGMSETEYVGVGVAAAILGVSRETIRRMIKRGDLAAEKIQYGEGRVTYRIKRTDLDNVVLNPPHRPPKDKPN